MPGIQIALHDVPTCLERAGRITPALRARADSLLGAATALRDSLRREYDPGSVPAQERTAEITDALSHLYALHREGADSARFNAAFEELAGILERVRRPRR